MLMMVAAAAMVTMLMMMPVFFLQLGHLSSQGSLSFHGRDQLFTSQLIPGRCDDGCLLVVLAQHCHSSIQFGLRHRIGAGQNDGRCGFNLIVVELAEVLHIDFHLTAVHNSHSIAQSDLISHNLLHSTNDIGQFAHTGGFNDNAVRIVLLNNLSQSLAEIAHQRAADTAGVHFSDIDAGILQETAIDADLAEFIFDENQLLSLIGLLNHFLDKGGLTCTQKTGIDINFHKNTFHSHNFLPYSITPLKSKGKGFFFFSSTAFDFL